MAENLLDVGPPNSKRPKLNSPALSASDGPGKGLNTVCTCKHQHHRGLHLTFTPDIFDLDLLTTHAAQFEAVRSARCAEVFADSSCCGFTAVLWFRSVVTVEPYYSNSCLLGTFASC